MDNMDNSNQQNNDLNNAYASYRREKNKNKSKFGKGLVAGILAGVLATVSVVGITAGIFERKGYLHFGANGEVYVQQTSTDDSDGIGSDVEGKLNAIDSLLDRNFYFGGTDDEKAENYIYKAFLDSYGDKYTVYYTPDEYKAILESTSGKFYGIGAVCQKNEDGSILIADPYEDAPAYKAGIRKGDCVVKVDGTDITDMDLSSAVALIKGDKGTTVNLEIRRGSQTLTFTVERAEVNVKTVDHKMMDDNIRSNPGGLLNSVVDILDGILPDGLIVYTETKSGTRKEYKGSNSNELKLPLAVLVNEDSASASEIFAGAVQDYGKGAIIGTKTFGKGIVQTIQPLTDGSAVKYTIAKYFTPKGQDIHGNGVTPDIEVTLPDDAVSDVQYEAAVNYLKGKMN